MSDENKVDVVSSYLESLNNNKEVSIEQQENSYGSGIENQMSKYIETTKMEESNAVEYEANKIVKCRRYKLYKKEIN